MIDIYRMNGEQARDMIEELARQVRWTRFELLARVRDWASSHTGRMKNKNVFQMTLDRLLQEVYAMDPDGHDINKLFFWLLENAPMRVKLVPRDDEPGCVTAYAESKILAVHDQSIGGSHWETPDDLDEAYACPTDHEDLVKELEAEGYILNTDEYGCYDPPEPEEPAVCPACGGPLEVLGMLGNRRHSRCRNCGIDTSKEMTDASQV